MTRTATAALLGLALLGCRDLGLEGNVPLEEAMERPPSELVAAVMARTPREGMGLVVDGRLWVPSGVPASIGATRLRPIGSADGHTVYARGWDHPPYDALFTRLEEPASGGATGMAAETWQTYGPVIGRAGGGAAAAQH